MSTHWISRARELRARRWQASQIARYLRKPEVEIRKVIGMKAIDDRGYSKAARDPKPVAPAPSSIPGRVTLPVISLPEVVDAPRVRKFAPRTRWTASEGAERWRFHHLKMVREGRFVVRDIVSEWVQ